MKIEKILILIGIAVLLYMFLQQPVPKEGAPAWQEATFWSKPGIAKVKATAILPQDVEGITISIAKIEVQNADGIWNPIVSGTIKLDLGQIVGKETVLGETKLDPGEYVKVKVELVDATMQEMSGRSTRLTVLDRDAVTEIDYPFTITENEPTYITLTFDTVDTIDKSNFFSPRITAR